MAKEFDNLQDVHSSVWQLTMASNTALGLWLDCVSCCFLTSVTFSFILLKGRKFFSLEHIKIITYIIFIQKPIAATWGWLYLKL